MAKLGFQQKRDLPEDLIFSKMVGDSRYLILFLAQSK